MRNAFQPSAGAVSFIFSLSREIDSPFFQGSWFKKFSWETYIRPDIDFRYIYMKNINFLIDFNGPPMVAARSVRDSGAGDHQN